MPAEARWERAHASLEVATEHSTLLKHETQTRDEPERPHKRKDPTNHGSGIPVLDSCLFVYVVFWAHRDDTYPGSSARYITWQWCWRLPAEAKGAASALGCLGTEVL